VLRDAVDADFLFHSSTGIFPEERTGDLESGRSGLPEDVPNVEDLPLSQLCSCRFGEGGVPAGQIIEEGEADYCLITTSYASNLFLLSEEYCAGLRGEGSGIAPQISLIQVLTSP